MAAVVDTSLLVELERAGRNVEPLRGLGAVVSAISIAELLHGARRADSDSRRARREAFVEVIVTRLPVIDFDLAIARRYAALWADTMAAGTPVAPHDLMIAATAQFLGWPVWTRNARDFRRVPGTRLLESGTEE
jgi:predicted nucleic acid-binding protein